MSIRFGGILVPVFALLAGCAASAGGGGSAGSTEDALGSADHGKPSPVHGGEDAAPPCDDASTPPPSTPPATPPCDDAGAPPPSDPPCDDASAPPPITPPCDDAGTPVTPDAAPPPASDAGTCSVGAYDGRATGLDVKLGVTALKLDGDLLLSDTDPLPAAGGTVTAHVLNLTEATLATVGVLDAQSTGTADATTSTVSVAGVALHIAGLGMLPDVDITANVLAAHAVASCDAASASTHGGADIAGLSIDGKAVVVTGFPNQTIDLGIGKIILNEVIKDSSSQSQGEIQIAALHVSIPNVADVLVSAASAGITCSCEAPEPTPPTTNPPSCSMNTDCRKGQSCYNGHCATVD